MYALRVKVLFPHFFIDLSHFRVACGTIHKKVNSGLVCVLVSQKAICLDWSFSIISVLAMEGEMPAWGGKIQSRVIVNESHFTHTS